MTNCISRHTVNFVSPTYSLTAFQIVGKEVQRIPYMNGGSDFAEALVKSAAVYNKPKEGKATGGEEECMC